MRDFKFFQKEERVFTQWMDEMDDYHLGGIRHAVEIPQTQLKAFNLNVLDSNIFGRIPSYTIAIEPDDYTVSYTFQGTIGQIIGGELGIAWCFTSMMIQRSVMDIVEINYNSVDRLDQIGLIFQPSDSVVVRYKTN
jgi:hypothetical protein